MNHEPEPATVLKLGSTRLNIEPDQAGSYFLNSSGTTFAGPFTRDEADQFALALRRWVRKADAED